MDNKINPNKLIPKSLVISGADTHLYRIGLSLFEVRGVRRRRWYNPVIMFASLTHLVRFLIYLKFTSVEDPEFHLYIGNICYFIVPRIESCLLGFSIAFTPICSQILN